MKLFTTEIFEKALNGNHAELRSVPKGDLHAHGGLSCSFERAQKIAPSISIPPEKFNSFEDFNNYLSDNYFGLSEDEFLFYEACLESMIDDGVVYCEMSLDLYMPSEMNLSHTQFAEKISELQRKYKDRLQFSPELGIHRGTPTDFWREELPQALETGIYKSVDLYGAYDQGSTANFKELFDICKNKGLRIKVHSGEFESNDSVAMDIKAVDVHALQHGITVAKNEALMQELVSRNISCNVCVTSNIKLAGINSVKEHPIRKMFDAGITITLGTDDLAVFRSTLSEEYLKLYKEEVFTVDELEIIRKNGLRNYQSNSYSH